MANYDILGNIAIVKFHEEIGFEEKLKKAREIMSQYKGVKTVLEKIDKVHGRLRTIKTKHILGEKTLEASYIENGCRFKLNVETCYFSPRLAGERNSIAEIINKIKNKKKLDVLVMFSGVSPFSIVIAKKCRKKINKITSIELGKECCKFAAENVKMNKVFDIVKVIPGDVKKVMPKILKANKMNKFDFVIMARPNLKETFLREGFMACRKKAIIIYYGFCAEKELESMLADIHKEAKEHKKKIKIINVKEAGDIAPYEHRYRIEIRVC